MATAEVLARRRRLEADGLNPRTYARDQIIARRQQRKLEVGDQTLLQWAMRVPEPKAGTLNFKAFPFQPEMYEVLGGPWRQVVVRKGTQVGVSTMTIRWALMEADRNGRTVLYIFPTIDDVYDFSDTRIQPLFEGEYLEGRKGLPFNKGLKRVGRGLVFFRGSESKRKLDSVDGDCLALDEYDTLNQANIPDAERRLSGPLSAGLIRRVGVPSLPEYGIAEKFDESDQRKWLVRCENDECSSFRGTNRERGDMALLVPAGPGGWQEMDFWRNVKWEEELGGKKIVNARRVCANCGEPIDVSLGKWVAQQPESDIPGFHVSRLIVPGTRLDDVVKASKKQAPYEVEVFYNKDLGMPYIAKTARLSPEEIAAAQRSFQMVGGFAGDGLVTMGVDVASERGLNVRISLHLDEERKKALWIGMVEDDDEGLAFDKLALLMLRYNVSMCGIDAMPESRLARQFQAKFWGRVYLIRLMGPAVEQVLSVKDDLGEALVRKLEALDATVEMIRRQRNLLPVSLPEGYVSHMTANVRKVEKQDDGSVKVFWHPTRPDDYKMAELYDLTATELFFRRLMIEQAGESEERPLDEMVEFNRSQVNTYGEQGDVYAEGPGGSHFGDGDAMYGDD